MSKKLLFLFFSVFFLTYVLTFWKFLRVTNIWPLSCEIFKYHHLDICLAKVGKASDNVQSWSEWPFWYHLFKNRIARDVRDKVNDFIGHFDHPHLFHVIFERPLSKRTPHFEKKKLFSFASLQYKLDCKILSLLTFCFEQV